jgi:hypothetical protein
MAAQAWVVVVMEHSAKDEALLVQTAADEAGVASTPGPRLVL